MEAYVEKNLSNNETVKAGTDSTLFVIEQSEMYKKSLVSLYCVMALLTVIFFANNNMGYGSLLFGLGYLGFGLRYLYSRTYLTISDKNVVYTDSEHFTQLMPPDQQVIPFSQIEKVTVSRYWFASWASITFYQKDSPVIVELKGVDNPCQVIEELQKRISGSLSVSRNAYIFPNEIPFWLLSFGLLFGILLWLTFIVFGK